MTIGLTYDEALALAPCDERFKPAARKLGGKKRWDGNSITAAQARDAGVSFDDIVWVASALARLNPDVARRMRLWATDCASHVLHIYEKQYPNDVRVRDCIVATRRYTRGEIGAATMGAARDAANDASDAAWAAASAASAAARAARDAAWDAAWAARAASVARAAASAAAWAASDAQDAWQFERLVAWLSDDEPEDWPLDPAPQPEARS